MGYFKYPSSTLSTVPHKSVSTTSISTTGTINKKEEEKMGLKIRKIKEMSMDEFKENEQGFDEIIFEIDKGKYEQHKKNYGFTTFCCSNESHTKFELTDDSIIQFLPKALLIKENKRKDLTSEISIPYDMIVKVEGVYYLKTE